MSVIPETTQHFLNSQIFARSEAKKVYKISNLTDEEATLVEPTACAIHGMDKLGAAVGVDVLIIGAGPTGLVLAQLLRLNGAAKIVIAANKGIKTEIAKQLNAGDEYIELDRTNPSAQWQKLKIDYPYGFDVVVRDISVVVQYVNIRVNTL